MQKRVKKTCENSRDKRYQMKLSVISFTKSGMELSRRVKACQGSFAGIKSTEIFTKWSGFQNEKNSDAMVQYTNVPIGIWAGGEMDKKHALLFIGACGIAVRAIAPYVTDKLCDSPVLVMDEMGRYVIPILSGHMGGANELAVELGRILDAVPVITTATDINNRFAVDLFAKKNHLAIMNRDGIAKVSAKILDGKAVTMAIEPGHLRGAFVPEYITLIDYEAVSSADIVVTSEQKKEWDAKLLLKPKIYSIGMGCRRGKNAVEVSALIEKILQEQGLSEQEIFALASIDKKAQEPCFLEWSRKKRVPFYTFSSEELLEVSGVFQKSEFVKSQVGVDNVCERAALKVCGEHGEIVVPKRAENGMTIAISKRDWSITFDET